MNFTKCDKCDKRIIMSGTVLDTPRYFTKEEVLDYFRHFIKEIDEGRAAAKDLNWQVEMGDGVSLVHIRFTLEQNTIKYNRRRTSTNT